MRWASPSTRARRSTLSMAIAEPETLGERRPALRQISGAVSAWSSRSTGRTRRRCWSGFGSRTPSRGSRPTRSHGSSPNMASAPGLRPRTELRTVSSVSHSPRPKLLDPGRETSRSRPTFVRDASPRPGSNPSTQVSPTLQSDLSEQAMSSLVQGFAPEESPQRGFRQPRGADSKRT